MNANYLNKLEYFKILETLSTFATTYIGKNMCLNLLPSNQKDDVKNRLLETDEAVKVLYRSSKPPLSEIADNTINLKTLESFGTLSLKSLLDITDILKIADSLKKYFYTDYIVPEDFEILNSIFSLLYSNSSIIKKIDTCILDENTLNDNASSNLLSIRKKQRNLEQDIKSKLTNFLHSSSYSKYIQENVVTIRNDRYVIPIKEEYRSQVKGFIHDVSSSGSTIFIEPISVFELNNELANLKIEENLEIEKILQDLSKLFYPYIEELKLDIECIGKLDFIFAKAKYSRFINAITPIINEEKKIVLENAKHPLLDPKKAVPCSLTLGKDFNTLVITGPNTGGKTVTLKTIGLLTCMACSGLNIPASQNSSIYVFDNVFADIGDDQSISDSLSTFSAHMKNIVDIVNNSTSNSLILVDELGSGTDPIEGASLAISVLDYFTNNHSLTVATTHYQELKKYALTRNDFENASVEFDINTLSPTYHLLIGVPGKSNAFEISRKLGLSEKIIENAKSNLTKKDVDFEELLKNIYDNKSKIEHEKAQISEELEKIETLKKSLERDNSKLLEQEKNLINDAKIKARNILLEAKEEANSIISDMNKIRFCVEVAVEKSLPLPQKSAKQGEKSSAPAKAVAFFFEKQGGKSSARQWARIFLRKTRRIGMKKLEIIIKPEKLEDLKALLDSEEVNGLNIVNSMGYGNQKGIIKNYRGAEYAVNLLPKIKVETVVTDEVAPKLIDKIVEQINTGHIGDGKIFMYEVEDAIRIRTGEHGVDAL